MDYNRFVLWVQTEKCKWLLNSNVAQRVCQNGQRRVEKCERLKAGASQTPEVEKSHTSSAHPLQQRTFMWQHTFSCANPGSTHPWVHMREWEHTHKQHTHIHMIAWTQTSTHPWVPSLNVCVQMLNVKMQSSPLR
eukprot:scaffold126645_cov17-Tisochrysis_lutea.AAC.1